jgi:hypothetical protein
LTNNANEPFGYQSQALSSLVNAFTKSVYSSERLLPTKGIITAAINAAVLMDSGHEKTVYHILEYMEIGHLYIRPRSLNQYGKVE